MAPQFRQRVYGHKPLISDSVVDRLISGYLSQFPAEAESVSRMRALIGGQDPLHLTASALLLNPSADSLGTVFNERFQMWLQSGGHIENGETPLEGAKREVEEETGIFSAEVHPWHHRTGCPIDLSLHWTNCEPSSTATWHLDFRYVLRTSVTDAILQDRIRWVPISEVTAGHSLPTLAFAVRKSIAGRLFEVD